MKRTLFISGILFFAAASLSLAQGKTEKYCQVIVAPKSGWTVKRVARISFGDVDSMFKLKDTTAIHQLKLVNTFTNEADVLNFMTKSGWSLVNVHSGGLYTTQEIFYFKKEFDKAELAE